MKMNTSLCPLFFIPILPIGLASCDIDPEFPVEPKIAFESINFNKSDNGLDTLILRVRFQDGDGDLGLSGGETDPPYQLYTPKFKENGEPCFFSDRFNTVDCAGLPLDYDCTNYLSPVRIGQDLVNDTVYVEYNENRNNFIVELMTKQNGQFEVFDLQNCQTLSGRFPRVKENFDTSSPLEGVIEFRPPSYGFSSIFRNDTIKLRIRIKDRALHESNTVESCEFTLNDLIELGRCPN